MIPIYKLKQLPPSQRRRKIIILLSVLEDKILSNSDTYDLSEDNIRSIINLVLEDTAIDETANNELRILINSSKGSLNKRRTLNTARHALLAVTGSLPAEWDLIVPWSSCRENESRFFFPEMYVYAEDIRSPFNIGSIFRTAEAFGAEKMFVSPLCVSPTHQRAQRSAMGCTNYLPWEIKDLSMLPKNTEVFALETGGTPIDQFSFPDKGIVILGSEELGVSPAALQVANYGRVSIPMHGIKASLNVSVAFGILMQYWSSYLINS